MTRYLNKKSCFFLRVILIIITLLSTYIFNPIIFTKIYEKRTGHHSTRVHHKDPSQHPQQFT